MNETDRLLDPLRKRLALLEEAEEREDLEEAVRLRTGLVTDRLLDRLQETPNALSELDLHLLAGFANDALRYRLWTPAMLIARSACDWAERGGDRYGVLHFRLVECVAKIGALDLTRAETDLCSLLSVRALPISEHDGLVAALDLGRELGPRRHVELQVGSLAALGRFWAAVGRLRAADSAFERASELAVQCRTSFVTAEEMAVRLAEVRLDRGDLAGFDRLAKSWVGNEVDVYWHFLAGSAALLAGHLSAANRHFVRAVDLAPRGWSGYELRRLATWKRFHCLAFLNRIDEAERELDRFLSEGGPDDEHLALARELLTFRHGRSELGLAPSPYEFRQGRPSAGSSLVADPSPNTFLDRQHERVSDEWAWRANGVRAALRRGDLALAEHEMSVLEQWIIRPSVPKEGVESELLRGRCRQLAALVLASLGDPGSAFAYAERARCTFQKLELPLEEWAACRILEHTFEDSDESREHERVRLRSRELLAIAEGRQDEGLDRSLFLLNKPSALDEQLDAILRADRGSESDEVALRSTLSRVLATREAEPGDTSTRFDSPLEFAGAHSRTPNKSRLRWRPRSSWLSADIAVLTYVNAAGRFLGDTC